jgi:hypothetical protein
VIFGDTLLPRHITGAKHAREQEDPRELGRLFTINADAAGIDVGSTFHVVAVSGNRDDHPVAPSGRSAGIVTAANSSFRRSMTFVVRVPGATPNESSTEKGDAPREDVDEIRKF